MARWIRDTATNERISKNVALREGSMFNLAEFQALQCQQCKDFLAEAERMRLTLEAEQAQTHSKWISSTAHGLLVRLSDIIHHP
jgi:hypothetical protein